MVPDRVGNGRRCDPSFRLGRAPQTPADGHDVLVRHVYKGPQAMTVSLPRRNLRQECPKALARVSPLAEERKGVCLG